MALRCFFFCLVCLLAVFVDQNFTDLQYELPPGKMKSFDLQFSLLQIVLINAVLQSVIITLCDLFSGNAKINWNTSDYVVNISASWYPHVIVIFLFFFIYYSLNLTQLFLLLSKSELVWKCKKEWNSNCNNLIISTLK